jgi:hypothetical protein
MNITKMLEKLDVAKRRGCILDWEELEEILLAGKEPYAHEVMLKEATRRMQMKVEQIESLERRVAELEAKSPEYYRQAYLQGRFDVAMDEQLKKDAPNEVESDINLEALGAERGDKV